MADQTEAHRDHLDVPFEYDLTDSQDVERAVREILDREPDARAFQITGHRRDEDGNGYFQVSWRTEK